MWKLAAIVHTIVGPTVMGALIVAVLMMPQHTTGANIALAAITGFVVSIPLSVLVARRLLTLTRKNTV